MVGKRPNKIMSNEISKNWKALQGSNNWEGLLEPLDDGLRESLLLYGDLIQATYDAFNNDAHSKYCGSSRYGKEKFFHKVMLAPHDDQPWDYKVTKFIYATSSLEVPEAFIAKSLSREAWSKESNWIGYVAVTTDEGTKRLGRRDIVVAWRGTTRNLEWVDVFKPSPASIELITQSKQLQPKHNNSQPRDRSKAVGKLQNAYNCLPLSCLRSELHDGFEESEDEPKVMDGWMVIYTSTDSKSPFNQTSARDQFLDEMQRLIALYGGEEDVSITMVGHSLGAALSVVSAFDLVYNGLSKIKTGDRETAIPVTAFVVGCPGVGNGAFKREFESLEGLRCLHLVNVIDVIPWYPGKFFSFEEVGKRLEIDTRKSSFLKESKDPGDWHNLQAHLHVVAGWQGKGKEWKMSVDRSLALVNKSCDFLKEECLVPASWWVEKNKGLVRDQHGMWVYAEPDDDDRPMVA